MKLKRVSRVRIAIRRKAPWNDNNRCETTAQQQGNTSNSRLLDNDSEKNISYNTIKQEDIKDASLTQQTVDIRDITDSADLDTAKIKQEDTLKKEALKAYIKNPITRGLSYYHCPFCEIKFADFRSVVNHRRAVHNLSGYSRTIKHMNLEPDVDNPNNTCQSCEKTYCSKKSYRDHLVKVHYVAFERKRVGPVNNMTPDPHDPNFYCCSCNYTYTSLPGFKAHLLRMHNIRVPPTHISIIKNPDVLPDWNDPNYYCSSCEHHFKTRSSFSVHCINIHHVRSPTQQRCKGQELPDLHDPKFHCKVCDTIYKNEQFYRSHCYEEHNMRMTISGTPNQDPNPNNECSICGKSFSVKYTLYKHLFVVHKMDIESVFQPSSTKQKINNSNNYCRVCDKFYASKQSLKYHSRAVHFIDEKTNQASDETKPDIDDPNNYCRVCQHTYASKKLYRHHIRHIHQMKLNRPIEHDSSRFPDPLGPNYWYCRICKCYSKSHIAYKKHCKKIHRMELMSLKQTNTNPSAEININEPNHCCAKYDRKMKNKPAFLQRLRRVRGMKLRPRY
ncbi:hypothetical protein MBANPS3_012494 [Mucor bainieri]